LGKKLDNLAQARAIFCDHEYKRCATEERLDTAWVLHPAIGQVKAAHRSFDLRKSGVPMAEKADVLLRLVLRNRSVLKRPPQECAGDSPPSETPWPG
jgi:hypothetical protein